MTDISSVVPGFNTAAFAHLIAPLERAGITTAELLCVQATEVARKAQIPPSGAAKLIAAVVGALDDHVQETETSILHKHETISFLDEEIDKVWNGGTPTRHVTEITGESGVGKTQYLLTLLLAVQLPPPQGLGRSALYISTEAALSTSRLSQILDLHPKLSDLPDDEKPTLSNIHAIQVPDLEAQDHILRYQVPVAIERLNIGLLVIDSIASNYRAEMDVLPSKSHGISSGGLGASTPTTPSTSATTGIRASSTHILAERRAHLIRLGSLLRDLAYRHNIAVVVSNQVADRFDSLQHTTHNLNSYPQNRDMAPSTAPQYYNSAVVPTTAPQGYGGAGITADPMTLDHQQRWITGWGDRPHDMVLNSAHPPSAGSASGNDKTPALGLAWTNQISARIALVKESSSSLPVRFHTYNGTYAGAGSGADAGAGKGTGTAVDEETNTAVRVEGKRRRWMRIVFASYMGQTPGRGVEYEITTGGVRAVGSSSPTAANHNRSYDKG